MSSAFVPSIKELASRITVVQATSILQRALELKTTAHVKRFMAAQLQEISPELRLLDTA